MFLDFCQVFEVDQYFNKAYAHHVQSQFDQWCLIEVKLGR